MRQTIYDPLRRKEVAMTPEEEVRQKMIVWLNVRLGFSLNLMMSEYSFKYNGLQYRADIVVFDKNREIKLLVECKAPSVEIDREVIEQGIRYNRSLNVKYILFTNGVSLCGYRRRDGSSEYEAISDMTEIK
ncbi:MAG: type I restriction enzyme HsdR N-terminal domain-containing protein [Bacteroidales bacterium]|nr:type I restriction enzyme HsdR N-terminal domain-containing protein [Bacteroidales bacterium]